MALSKEEATGWVNENNMVGEFFHSQGNVMSVHVKLEEGHWQYAIARWWYGEPHVLVVFKDGRILWYGED